MADTENKNPNYNTVFLSDGQPLVVRRLGLFELDDLTPPHLGPFTYKIKIVTSQNVPAQEHEAVFDISGYKVPPEKPDTSKGEPAQGSAEWYQLLDWQLYQAAQEHERKREEAVVKYYGDVSRYVLENCIEDSNAVHRIVTPEDWELVMQAALVEQVTVELLAKTLNDTYQATYEGLDVFEAMHRLEKSRGTYNVVHFWENRLMLELGMDEITYSMLPVKERARKICAYFLPDILTALDMDRSKKEMDAKAKRK